MAEVGKCRMSEQDGEVHIDAPESGDVVWSDQEDIGGRTTVEKFSWMHQIIENHYYQSRRKQEASVLQRSEAVSTRQWRCVMVGPRGVRKSENGGEGKQCVPDSGDAIWSRKEQKVRALQGRETVCIRQWRCVMVGPGGCRRSDHSGL
jgi:hypothetical protein